MKIICIGKNYAEHIKEMKSAVPSEPVFFMKPDTAIIKDGQPFYYPDFSKEVHHEVEIVLSDTGPGIKADTVRRIFDPFFSTKEVGEGTGLGLAIAYHLIKMHRGEIYVYSPALGEPHSGRGTSFLIRMPEVEGDDGEAGH